MTSIRLVARHELAENRIPPDVVPKFQAHGIALWIETGDGTDVKTGLLHEPTPVLRCHDNQQIKVPTSEILDRLPQSVQILVKRRVGHVVV